MVAASRSGSAPTASAGVKAWPRWCCADWTTRLPTGQPIYAVVKSSVANHDGRSNGITAPNRRSQVELMRRALSLADVEAGQIAFVEAHGTGTVLGDMIEANALGDIHKSGREESCLLGSIKGNIGHTEGSAGIAAFIKACLALNRGVLPATLFGDTENPALRLETQGLRLAKDPEPLPANALGGVSSFGLGGSNAHVVLESAPPLEPPTAGAAGVLTVSGPSEQALRRNVDSIATALHTLDDQRLASWCRTTNVVKRSHRHRLVLARRPRHAGRWAAGLSRRRPYRTGVVRTGCARSRPESGSCALGRGPSTRA